MAKEIVAVPTEKIQSATTSEIACRITTPTKLEIEIYNEIQPTILETVLKGLTAHD